MRSARRAGIDRQVGRPPQERRRGGEPAARLRPARGPLELGRDVLVGTAAWPVRDARRGDPARARRRSRPPAPRARSGAPDPKPTDRRPTARADAGSAPVRRRPAARSAPRARAPCRATPSRVAARHISAGSPTGSAAATSSSSRVSGGSSSSRRRKLSSIRPDSGSGSGSPNPPASCAAESPRGSSSSASGLPRVSATIRSRTRSSSRPGMTVAEQRAGVVLARGPRAAAPGGRPDRRCAARLAHREHDRHRLRQQPPRDEPEDLARGAVEPLRVVDEADQRLLVGDLGQQGQRRRARPGSGRAGRRTRGRARRAARPAGAREGRRA